MKQTRTRILSLLMALIMCLGLLPVTALAAGGSSGEPYLFLDPNQDPSTGYVRYIDSLNESWLQILPDLTPIPSSRPWGNGTDSNVDTETGTSPVEDGKEYTLTVILSRMDGSQDKQTSSYPSGTGLQILLFDNQVYHRSFVSTAGSPVSGNTSTSLRITVTSDITLYAMESYRDATRTLTLDYNGAGATKTENVKIGSTFTPPTPTLSGYRFLGWYAGTPKNGYLTNYYKESSFTALYNDLTLYAMWEKESASGYTITFDPNGGTVNPTSKQTGPDGKVPGGYPTPTREGYKFLGWYTDGDDYKPADDEVWGGDQTLVAKWEKAAEAARITFYPNGGRITKFKGVTVPEKNPDPGPFYIGEDGTTGVDMNSGWGWTVTGENGFVDVRDMPTVERAGYTFDGWYIVSGSQANQAGDGKLTNFTGLTRIDISTAPFYPDGVELTAKWTADENILKGLTYQFGNNRKAFGYSNTYEIPQERYEMVLGKTQGEFIYTYYGKGWGGSCYGMAATSGMFFHGNGTTTTASFRNGAEVPYDLFVTDRNSTLNMTLTEYIEAVFVSQYANLIQDDYDILANLNDLARSAAAVQSTKAPVMIAIRGETISLQGKRVESGHAVLGYDVVEISSTESHLMVYDPNFPNEERYITLTKSGNNYVSWAYKMNNRYDWGTGKPNNKISVVPYSDYSQAWNNRAVHSNDPALFLTNATNASLLDSTGTIVATIKNGTVSTSSSDITPILTYGVTSDGIVPDNDASAMWLPAGQYTIQTTDTSSKELEATLADVNQSATVSAAAKSITFAVNDDKALNYVQIDQAGAKYEITLSSTLNQGHSDVQLTGTTAAGGISFAQISGTLYGEGVDSGAALKVDGKSAAISSLSGNMPDIENLGTAGTSQPAAATTFPDVKPTAWYAPAVAYASSHGYMNGNADGTFNPDGQVKGTEFAQILYNKEGKPAAADSTSFKGVADQWYAPAILWAADKGIITDTGETAIVPTDSLTRQQIALMLYNYMGKPAGDADLNKFSDADKISDWAVDAVKWSVSEGIFQGNADGTFNPTGTAKRSETAQILMNFFG